MAGPRWCALPTWWTRQLGLPNFTAGGQAGASLAALKVVTGVALLANYHSRKARSSLTDLSEITGLSRPMVLEGTAVLQELKILRVDKSNHVNEYELTQHHLDDKWCKLPHDNLRAHLKEISNRGAVPLAALKIYLQLAAIRPNESPVVALTHEKMREFTGIQKAHVRRGLDILYSHNLLHVEYVDDQKTKTKHNTYLMLGL
jgi:hypothetical protein